MPRRPMPLPPRAIRADRIVVWGFSLGTGVAVALAAEQPVGKLILEAPYTSIADVAASAFRFAPVRLADAGSVPFRRAHRAGQGSAADHAWRARSHDSIAFGERLFALAHEPKRFVRFPEGGHNDLDNFGAIEIARHFINACKRLMAAVDWRILRPRTFEDLIA